MHSWSFPAETRFFRRRKIRRIYVISRTDSEDIMDIAYITTQQCEPTVAIITPMYRYLPNTTPRLSSEIEDLHVKHISVYALLLEKLERYIAFEELETALRVWNVAQANNDMDEHAESR